MSGWQDTAIFIFTVALELAAGGEAWLIWPPDQPVTTRWSDL